MSTAATLRRVALATVALSTGVLVLAGCGRSADGSDTAAAGAAVNDSPATGDVTIWAFDNEGKALSELATSFMKENPDATVTVTPVSSEELPRKLDTAIASGQVPDIVQPSTGLQSYVAAGGIAPVPDGVMEDWVVHLVNHSGGRGDRVRQPLPVRGRLFPDFEVRSARALVAGRDLTVTALPGGGAEVVVDIDDVLEVVRLG